MTKTNKLLEKRIYDKWSPILKENVSITDPYKLSWLSKYAELHESYERDQFEPLGESYLAASLSNVNGMGPVTLPNMSANQTAFYNNAKGSGDNFPTLLPLAIQIAARTIGFDIVSVVPMNGPTGVLPYLDYQYAGGRLDSADNPHAIAIKAGKIAGADYVVGSTYWGLGAAQTGTATVAGLKMKYVGKSRITGKAIFRILGSYDVTFDTAGVAASSSANDAITIADVFDGSAIIAADSTGLPDESVTTAGTTQTAIAVTESAELVRALEDHIQGFAGAGAYDTDDWSLNGPNPNKDISPMTRGTGETTYFRTMGMKVYTKNIEAKTYKAAVTVTTEQIQDLNRQFGLDIMSLVEANLINEISQGINAHILDRAFKLGWTNHANIYDVEGISLNLNLKVADTAGTNTGAAGTVYYKGMYEYDPTDSTYPYDTASSTGIPYSYFANYGNWENLTTIQRRVKSRVLAASNVIMTRGRRGPGTFVVTNLQIATALQDSAQYTVAPMANTISQEAGSLYPLGTVAGMTIYVDPRMAFQDNRVLVGRKGSDDEPGIKFMPYIMAELTSTIVEGTMAPKTAIMSRYALCESGHFPECQYVTFDVLVDENSGLW